jgi:hypothetical protein
VSAAKKLKYGAPDPHGKTRTEKKLKVPCEVFFNPFLRMSEAIAKFGGGYEK